MKYLWCLCGPDRRSTRSWAYKVSEAGLDKVAEQTLQTLSKRAAAYPGIIVTSPEIGAGIDDLRAVIAQRIAAN